MAALTLSFGSAAYSVLALADDSPAMAPSMTMHKPDPKRMADFQACQKDAGVPATTDAQQAKVHACMEAKKPTAPPPTSGDKMAYIKAQMASRAACDKEAGITRPSKEQMEKVHTCMDGKGYKMHQGQGQ